MTPTSPVDPALLARVRATGGTAKEHEAFARQFALAVVTGNVDAATATLAVQIWGGGQRLTEALGQYAGLPRVVALCWTARDEARVAADRLYGDFRLLKAIDFSREQWVESELVSVLTPETPVTRMGLRLWASSMDVALTQDLEYASKLCVDLLAIILLGHALLATAPEAGIDFECHKERVTELVTSMYEALPLAQQELAAHTGRTSQ